MNDNTRRWCANELARVLWSLENGRLGWRDLRPRLAIEPPNFRSTGGSVDVPGYMPFRVDAMPLYRVEAMSLTITRNKYGEALAGLESMGLMPAWREFLAAKRFSSPFWKVRRESSVRRASSASVELADACLYILDNHVMVSP